MAILGNYSTAEKLVLIDRAMLKLSSVTDKGSSFEFVSQLKIELELTYRDFVFVLTRALYKLGFPEVFGDCLNREYKQGFSSDPQVSVLLCNYYLANNEIDSVYRVISEVFDDVNSEWVKLELVEVLCDAHLWDLAANKLPYLSFSGDASKNKYKKIKKRIELSLLFDNSPNINVYYINLDKDDIKRERMERRLQTCSVKYVRVPGVLAKNLPEYAQKKLHRSYIMKNQVGALGCFLGHINALERIVKDDADFGLVLEDDAYFFYRPSEYILEKILIQGYDLVYVNSRMMKRDHVYETPLNIDPILLRLSILSDGISGWGGDGYVVTKNGAKLLLDNFSHDLAIGHYDGQLGAYGLIGSEVVACNKATKLAENLLKRLSRKSAFVKCGCLDFPMVSFKEYGSSSRVSNS
jgi:GR25 family glycosyltransferase involved in LPS biosynthesis